MTGLCGQDLNAELDCCRGRHQALKLGWGPQDMQGLFSYPNPPQILPLFCPQKVNTESPLPIHLSCSLQISAETLKHVPVDVVSDHLAGVCPHFPYHLLGKEATMRSPNLRRGVMLPFLKG